MELVSGTEVTEEYGSSADGDGSISVAGNSNTTAGGDKVMLELWEEEHKDMWSWPLM